MRIAPPDVRIYSFAERLAMSEGIVAATVPQTIAAFLPGCISVIYEHDRSAQRQGIDYRATLRGGAIVGVDLKAREPGCAKFWCQGPELALELYSIVPGSHSRQRDLGAAGWTLDEGKATDYTLHVFDAADSDRAYLLPFQLLRAAFRRRVQRWQAMYRGATQHTRRDGESWDSQCLFVPAGVVIGAITSDMQARRLRSNAA